MDKNLSPIFSAVHPLQNDAILNIHDLSTRLAKRARIELKNGYQVSVAVVPFTHSARQGLFGIAIFNKLGEMDDSLLDHEDQGNKGVCDYCDHKKVLYYINKISQLP